jgi:hypothetical protein
MFALNLNKLSDAEIMDVRVLGVAFEEMLIVPENDNSSLELDGSEDNQIMRELDEAFPDTVFREYR